MKPQSVAPEPVRAEPKAQEEEREVDGTKLDIADKKDQ